MNKIFLIGVLVLAISMATVSALDVSCSDGRWNTDVCREGELQDEFDIVTSSIDEVETTIIDNSELWLAGDGKGTSLSSVKRYLGNEYSSYLNETFATQNDLEFQLEQANLRIDELEARLNVLEKKTHFDVKTETRLVTWFRHLWK